MAPHTTRWIVRFGYNGGAFRGWARQPGLRTVEGEIRRGLVHFGVARDADSLGLEVASRTDRGVSARANALVLQSRLSAATLLRSLNGIDPDLFFTAASPLPEEYRVRHAVRRTYRYFEARSTDDKIRLSEATALFTGRIDVRSFGRALPLTQPVWREIESTTVRPYGSGRVYEVRAPAFVWGMVRKIVGALREVESGRLSTSRLRAALEGRVRLTLPMAEPESLVLWEVEYPFPWTVFWQGPNRPQSEGAVRRRADVWTRARILDSIAASSRE